MLQTLAVARQAKFSSRVGEAQDIQPEMMNEVRGEVTEFVQEYLRQARGPSKSEALVEFFQSWLLDGELAELLRSIDSSFDTASNKVRLLLSESARSEARLQTLLDQLTSALSALDLEKESLVRDKTLREVEIEDLQRQLAALDDEKSGLLHLKQAEAANLRAAHDSALSQK